MTRHLLVSNLFASKVHEIVSFLARSEREFVASQQIQKRTNPNPNLRIRKVHTDDWNGEILCLYGWYSL